MCIYIYICHRHTQTHMYIYIYVRVYGVGVGLGWGGGINVYGHAHADLHTRWMLRWKIFSYTCRHAGYYVTRCFSLPRPLFVVCLPGLFLAPGLCLVFSNFALNLLISKAALGLQLSKRWSDLPHPRHLHIMTRWGLTNATFKQVLEYETIHQVLTYCRLLVLRWRKWTSKQQHMFVLQTQKPELKHDTCKHMETQVKWTWRGLRAMHLSRTW